MHHRGHFSRCHPTPQRGNMFLCLRLLNIFLRLIASQALQSSTGVVLYVCAHGDGVDWFGCHPPTRLQPPPLAFLSPLHFYILQSFTQFLQSLSYMHLLSIPAPASSFLYPGNSWKCFCLRSFNPHFCSRLFHLLYHFHSNLTQLHEVVCVFAPWPLCNIVTEVTADRFLRKSDCRVW